MSICAGIAIPYVCASIARCSAAALMGPCERWFLYNLGQRQDTNVHVYGRCDLGVAAVKRRDMARGEKERLGGVAWVREACRTCSWMSSTGCLPKL